jgi:hypothetical protein
MNTLSPQEDLSGFHNANLETSRSRLVRGSSYRDLSTICLIPTRGAISAKIVQSWMGLMTPMNQKFMRLFIENMEVGEAYNWAIEQILANPELSKWKYILTLEEDNAPPPDGLLKLYDSMDKFDVIGGLYWIKGENGTAMIYGDPSVMPRNYIPQIPVPDAIQPANGLGMGFTLFKMSAFKKVPKPWFKTLQEYTQSGGVKSATQDLYFFDNAAKHGLRFASDNRVRVGHWDDHTKTMW